MFTPISLESFLAALPAISALVLLGNMDNHSHVLPGRSRREDIRKIGQCEKCSIFLPRVITLSSVKNRLPADRKHTPWCGVPEEGGYPDRWNYLGDYACLP